MRCRRLPFMNAFGTKPTPSRELLEEEEATNDGNNFVGAPLPLSKISTVACILADKKDSVEIMPARTATEAAFETSSAMRSGQRVIVTTRRWTCCSTGAPTSRSRLPLAATGTRSRTG